MDKDIGVLIINRRHHSPSFIAFDNLYKGRFSTLISKGFSAMARALRAEYPGAFYHVINRGNAGDGVFKALYSFKSNPGQHGNRALLLSFLPHEFPLKRPRKK
jgi:hypothetical protein